MSDKLVIGVDFGSDSVRAVLVDANTGETITERFADYPRWKQGLFCDEKKAQYRQHPLDYLDSLTEVLKEIASYNPILTKDIVGIAVDTTGSTVAPVNRQGVPLSLTEDFAEDPDAMFLLWKDHSSIQESEEIDRGLSTGKIDYTKYQGKYSAEWFWAKILHVVRNNKKIRDNAYSWVEHSDWIAGELTGNTSPDTITHNSCAAGHKALWNSEFGGLPDRATLAGMDPYLGYIYDRYQQKPKSAGDRIGTLCTKWARITGLSKQIVVGCGTFDAHAGAVGVGVAPHTLVKVVGTSTVDIMVMKPKSLAKVNTKPFCGIAENSVIPGYLGVEAGQSAFGDTYAWFKKLLLWPLTQMQLPKQSVSNEITEYISDHILSELEREAKTLDEDTLVATDWFNGRRYPYLNENAKATITGLTMESSAPSFYRALVKATIFGSKRIYDSLKGIGASIDRVICVGGIALKSEYVMQMMADTLNIPIMVSKEKQSCARGAAIYAAVAAQIYPDIPSAQCAMCEQYIPTYYPESSKHEMLMKDYKKYQELGMFSDNFEGGSYSGRTEDSRS